MDEICGCEFFIRIGEEKLWMTCQLLKDHKTPHSFYGDNYLFQWLHEEHSLDCSRTGLTSEIQERCKHHLVMERLNDVYSFIDSIKNI